MLTVFTEKMHLRSAERVTYIVALSVLAIDLVMIAAKASRIDWQAYGGLVAISALLFAGGAYYRLSARSERIASALICTSAFLLLTMAVSAFNYLLLPVSSPIMDAHLAKWDAMLGFHWPDAMALAAQYPAMSALLKACYNSTIPQLTLLVVILGLVGRHRDLHVMLLTVVASATTLVCFWAMFPSFGSTTYYSLPSETWAAISPTVGPLYREELLALAQNGPGIIRPDEIRGLIAFPSYHATLAFIAMAAARNVKYLFPVFLVLNLLILPATIIHGGHFLVDLFGGALLFAISRQIALKVVGGEYRVLRLPEIVTN